MTNSGRNLLIAILIFVPLLTCTAQSKGKKVQRQVAAHNALFEQLLPNTAKVMFFDSIVADKDDFASLIPANRETGTVQVSQNGDYTFTNGWGDVRLTSYGDSTREGIWQSDLVGSSFTKPHRISTLSEGVKGSSMPFLKTDGVTIFFSGEGEESIGKKDLYMSRYDSESRSYLEPENVGLPFNSPYNDLMLVIDDYDSIGWLVTDRYQPKGKVCIYLFEPQTVRTNLQDEDLTPAQIRSIAELKDISATWRFGNRDRALKRLQDLLARTKATEKKDEFCFVINDKVVYHLLSDFQTDATKQKFMALTRVKQSLNESKNRLLELRTRYKKDPGCGSEIQTLENSVRQMEASVPEMEKTIRIMENQAIK